MKINKIEQIEEIKGKIRIHINNGSITVPLSATNDIYIYPGKELTIDEYTALLGHEELGIYLKYIERISARFRYTQYEICRKLRTKFPSILDISIRNICTILLEGGIIDDMDYARTFVSEKALNGLPRRRIDYALREKGITEYDSSYLENDVEYINMQVKRATEIILKKIRSNRREVNMREIKQKAKEKLYNIGYQSNIINKVLKESIYED